VPRRLPGVYICAAALFRNLSRPATIMNLAGGEQDTVVDLHAAEAAGGSASGGRVQVLVESRGPHAQPAQTITSRCP
jgi:hypothetical protein